MKTRIFLGSVALAFSATWAANAQTVINVTDSSGGMGPNTLYAAIAAHNANPQPNTTIDLSGLGSNTTILLGQQFPVITADVTIIADNANELTLDGNGNRIFEVGAGTGLTLRKLTLANGAGPQFGGAISNVGTLVIEDCVLRDSTTDCGGAIRNWAAGILTIRRSCFHGNRTTGDSGAIEALGGTVTVFNSTFSDNLAGGRGGAFGMFGGATLDLDYCTIYDNEAVNGGGGISADPGTTVKLHTSVVAGNRSDVVGTENLSVNGQMLNFRPNVLEGDPKLRPLDSWGFAIPYHLPELDSPLIDGSDGVVNPAEATDQRGFTRLSLDPDIGAVEVNIEKVTRLDDPGPDVPGTLRYAINSTAFVATVWIDYIDVRIGGVIQPNSNLPTILKGAVVVGLGAARTIIDGGNSFELFEVASNARAAIENMTITKGNAGGNGGGAIENGGGRLHVRRCWLQSNVATTLNGGGAISNNGGELFIDGCTFDSNVASAGNGGAISTNKTFTATNCTFFQNRCTAAGGDGGAIFFTGNNSIAKLVHCSLIANFTSRSGGGVSHHGDEMEILNCFFSENTAGSGAAHIDVFGAFPVLIKHGTVEAPSSVFPFLGDWGGPTPVISLPRDSLAIGAAVPTTLAPKDQLGQARPQHGLRDAGAVEYFGDNGLEVWRAQHFTPEELCSLGLQFTRWGNTADPDGDGRTNLNEALRMTDPLVADTPARKLEFHFIDKGLGRVPRLRTIFSTPITDIVPVEGHGSADLRNWSSSGILTTANRVGPNIIRFEACGTSGVNPREFFLRFDVVPGRQPVDPIPLVAVAETGNSVDPANGIGAVAYPFMIGKYEITAGQWAAFLNAVDQLGFNALGLYDASSGVSFSQFGLPGSKYGTFIFGDLFPVSNVTIFDAMRFCNWLHNGAHGAADTESGAYLLLGGTSIPSNAASIARLADARFAIPTQDEWHKAGNFISQNPLTYSTYGQGQNTINNNTPPGDSASANYNDPQGKRFVASYPQATSPWGCYDMTGNVAEWTETRILAGSEFYVTPGASWAHPAIAAEPPYLTTRGDLSLDAQGLRIVRLR